MAVLNIEKFIFMGKYGRSVAFSKEEKGAQKDNPVLQVKFSDLIVVCVGRQREA